MVNKKYEAALQVNDNQPHRLKNYPDSISVLSGKTLLFEEALTYHNNSLIHAASDDHEQYKKDLNSWVDDLGSLVKAIKINLTNGNHMKER